MVGVEETEEAVGKAADWVARAAAAVRPEEVVGVEVAAGTEEATATGWVIAKALVPSTVAATVMTMKATVLAHALLPADVAMPAAEAIVDLAQVLQSLKQPELIGHG